MKKLFIFLNLFFLICLTSCTEKIVTSSPSFIVSFDSMGGSIVSEQIVEAGQKAIEPTNPFKENSTFLGWYEDETLFDFNTEITKDTYLTASWEEIFQNYGLPVLTITLEDITISQSGYYTSMEEVGSFIYSFHRLPDNYRTKSQFNKQDYTEQNKLSVGGDVFYNREGLLPAKTGRTFTECDIDYKGGARGARRIVYSSDFLIFYTNDHYSSFYILRFL